MTTEDLDKTYALDANQPTAVRSRTNIFVRNVPFDATDKEFEEFFAQFGPLRGCFLVKQANAKSEPTDPETKPEAGEGKSKGFGFVHFASIEDAQKALDSLATTKLKGRKLKAEFALRKHAKFDKDLFKNLVKEKKLVKERAPPLDSSISLSKKATSPSTTLLVNFETSIVGLDKKTMYKKVRKFGTVAKLEYPMEDGTAKVTYAKVKDAQRAQLKLDGHIFKGAKMTATMVMNSSLLESSLKKSKSPAVLLKHHRLIVRNLPFSVDQASLTKLFDSYGNIVEISVPKSSANKARGFAFVQFKNREDAALAMAGINGTEIAGRVVAVDWAVQKTLYDKISQQEQATKDIAHGKLASKAETGEIDADKVDAGLTTDSANLEEENNDSFDNITDEDSRNDSADDATDNEGSNSVDTNRSSVGNLEKNNCTVFIRNLSFDTSEEMLCTKMQEYGPVEYCKLVVFKETGASRGTAFVCFKSADTARHLCELSAKICQDDIDTSSGSTAELTELSKKRTGKIIHSVLVDQDINNGSGIILDGRALNIIMAVDKDRAQKLKVEAKASSFAEPNKDKRHLGLVSESLIRPASVKAKSFWKPDMVAARERMVKARVKELQKNPNNYVSVDRMSIRHLPALLDESDLRNIMAAAIKAATELITNDPLALLRSEQNSHGADHVASLVDAAIRLKPRLVQVKIVRAEPTETSTIGRSKGYGFVQWRHHIHCLLVLRYLTNYEPQMWKQMFAAKFERKMMGGGSVPAPFIEFATEKAFVVQKRTERQTGVKSFQKRSNIALDTNSNSFKRNRRVKI